MTPPEYADYLLTQMITGFNTDVDYSGKVFHVQTEDRGLGHPVIESLVYCGGEIIASRRLPYSDLAESASFSETDVQRRMEEQHTRLIREIRNGKFDSEELRPFGHNIVTNRSLDEVVLSFLEEQLPLEQILLKMTGPRVLRAGGAASLRLEVTERHTERPIRGATVCVRLAATGTAPIDLFEAVTDEAGRVMAAFDIPALEGANAALVCSAEAGERRAEIRRLIGRSEAGASPD